MNNFFMEDYCLDFLKINLVYVALSLSWNWYQVISLYQDLLAVNDVYSLCGVLYLAACKVKDDW